MPPYPIIRTWLSLATILGVVPEAISAWNPDRAPQAIVMNTNGNSFPANTGPVPSRAKSVTAWFSSMGLAMTRPIAEEHDDADLHERGQVVTRGQQHPDGQDRGDETVDDQSEDQRRPGTASAPRPDPSARHSHRR